MAKKVTSQGTRGAAFQPDNSFAVASTGSSVSIHKADGSKPNVKPQKTTNSKAKSEQSPGFAKASPNFKDVKKKDQVEDPDKAIADNTLEDDNDQE